MNNTQDTHTLPKHENHQNIELRPHTHLHEQAIKGHQTNSTIAGPNGIQEGIVNQGLAPTDNSHLKQHNPNGQLKHNENHTHQRIDTDADTIHPLQETENELNTSSNEQQPNTHNEKDAAGLAQDMKNPNNNNSNTNKKPSISFNEPSTHASIVQDTGHANKADNERYNRDAAAAAGTRGEATGTAVDSAMTEHKPGDNEKGDKEMKDGVKHAPKPKNTGGDAHHIAEQEPMGLGGLTGKQPVGEINFKTL
ncbi:hypothetical protein BCV72DRAFT_262118 [Rhizopus microsporus var. microsporus]|uniref:Uncharacterized protein n=2 Tax=Rhizopus microsporus TaxID=58291 RepID=A0A2G4SYK8_RHIZD|nr:uncharacterized protein RHIMIDRAFT_312196 [Rhizopus microsporus ATCC 52813]ORE07456.1 hypothetical protein BCV72DRAFT_262118 [Rhizopus microsporus var. microsporus]PHZ13827.1 hypothetical protein RHIMIDRAFT_312196 [Rhizopus microsporus ATCC 52813]